MTLLDVGHTMIGSHSGAALTVLFGVPVVVLLSLLLAGREMLRVVARSAFDRFRPLVWLVFPPLVVALGFIVLDRVVLYT